jgi:hypothetical protein
MSTAVEQIGTTSVSPWSGFITRAWSFVGSGQQSSASAVISYCHSNKFRNRTRMKMKMKKSPQQ